MSHETNHAPMTRWCRWCKRHLPLRSFALRKPGEPCARCAWKASFTKWQRQQLRGVIRSLCQDTTFDGIGAELGCHRHTVAGWYRGSAFPSAQKIADLYKYAKKYRFEAEERFLRSLTQQGEI